MFRTIDSETDIQPSAFQDKEFKSITNQYTHIANQPLTYFGCRRNGPFSHFKYPACYACSPTARSLDLAEWSTRQLTQDVVQYCCVLFYGWNAY